jgi:putative ABC transport system ATP-binding protein
MFYLKNVQYKNILNIQELRIHKNKITCILGESGAGKSTLLKLFNKIISYDTGDILYNEKSLKEVNSIDLRREVVMLPQSPSIYPGSIKDNLLIGLNFSGKALVNDQRLDEIMNFIRLNKQLNEEASKLSGGEKQRVALGRVLLLEPEVFLLDEPSSALDETTAALIIDRLVQYTKQKNKSMIMVTHSKQIANKFADEIIQIDKGSVKLEEVK